MARIQPLEYAHASTPARAEFEQQIQQHGRMTNMKRTLAHSLPALHALMEWYPLRDEVAGFLGDRTTTLFAHAISAQSDCLICSTFFRRLLIDAGENPDGLEIGERAAVIVEFGRQLVKDANNVSDELYGRLAQQLTPSQIVTLTAFGALMIATNLFNNALRVDLDDYLASYQAGVR
ncbi:MAG: hypothetical protein ABSH09_34525 [Bryobacteraceae bacterium]